jgi:hypothetical protein
VHQLVFDGVHRVWPACRACCHPDSHEDDITRHLVIRLRQDRTLRDGPIRMHIESQQEHLDMAESEEGAVTGYIDISILFFIGKSRPYLAIECKRLNVIGTDGYRRSLATEYVEAGMLRFVREQYARELPLGGMIGYVMDGDVSFAFSSLRARIQERASDLCSDDTGVREILPPSRFVTVHLRPTRPIELRHYLLSLS